MTDINLSGSVVDRQKYWSFHAKEPEKPIIINYSGLNMKEYKEIVKAIQWTGEYEDAEEIIKSNGNYSITYRNTGFRLYSDYETVQIGSYLVFLNDGSVLCFSESDFNKRYMPMSNVKRKSKTVKKKK